jgi:hypothetical protein
MSAEPEALRSAHAPPLQERDVVAWRMVSLTALLVLLVTASCATSAWLLIRARLSRAAPPGYVSSRGTAVMATRNGIEMHLFRAPPASLRSAASDRLRSYGWADPEHRTLHIPIRRAVALYLAGVRVERPTVGQESPQAGAAAEQSR